jgi:hypothetical protein
LDLAQPSESIALQRLIVSVSEKAYAKHPLTGMPACQFLQQAKA